MSTFFKSVVNFGSSILFGHADVENSRREEDHHRAKLDSHTQASMQHLSTAKSPFKIQKCSFTHTTIRDHDVDYQHRSKPQVRWDSFTDVSIELVSTWIL